LSYIGNKIVSTKQVNKIISNRQAKVKQNKGRLYIPGSIYHYENLVNSYSILTT